MATTHIVRQGECLSSIARSYGFSNWRTIYDHPQNAGFKQKRPNPNLIYPGDEIFIPDKDPKLESRGTDKKHKFQVKAQKTLLRIVIADEDGQPYSRHRYRLSIGEDVYEGATGEDGLIEMEIPVHAEEGELTVWGTEGPPTLECTWTLKIGHLDPIEELTGVQARLNNLGFDCGSVDGIIGPRTRTAVRAFQEKHRLAVDGIPGPQTQAKLLAVHGC